MPANHKAIIIGSGVAGLACAIRLAVQGFEVHVFEKNSYPGGKLYLLEENGYRFDTGPSLFVQPQNIEELFDLACEDIHQYFNYKPVDIACKYFYEDGTIINAYTEPNKFAAEVETKTGEPAQHVHSYLNDGRKIYENIGHIFLNQSLHKTETWAKPSILKALLTSRPGYIFSSLHKANTKAFRNKHVMQLFDRYATYNGSDPYQAPAMFKLVSHIEHNEGVFYPEGGMISINNALYQLALKKSVTFHFNADVQSIIKENGFATGITINNENFYADVVVSDVDIYFTYAKLLNNKTKAEKILQQERSSSALIFYWGIKKEFSQLQLHNIFFSNDYEAEFKSIFKTKQPFHDPTIYINITSKNEPGVHAPIWKENWFVMVNVPGSESIIGEKTIMLYRKNIIEKLNRMLQTDINDLIEFESILDPKMIEEKTASFSGALYGSSSNSWKAAFLRHPNFSKDIQRLYFVGGSVHPGGGIPLCLKSAKIASALIKKDRRK